MSTNDGHINKTILHGVFARQLKGQTRRFVTFDGPNLSRNRTPVHDKNFEMSSHNFLVYSQRVSVPSQNRLLVDRYECGENVRGVMTVSIKM